MVLVASCSLPGTRYGMLNQDYVIVEQLLSPKELKKCNLPQCYLIIVLDGHGLLGELASQEAGQAMLEHIKASELFGQRHLADIPQDQVLGVVEAAFAAGHNKVLGLYASAPASYAYPKGSSSEKTYTLKADASGDQYYANGSSGSDRLLEFGTTATLVLLQGSEMVVANVGDTSAVLGREDYDGGKDLYTGVPVSLRHFGHEPEEIARLKEGWGDAVSLEDKDGYITVAAEGRLQGLSLAMSRALGHRLMADFGVVATPTVSFLRVHPEDACLIVATDGVWEVMTPGEVVRTVCDKMAEGGTVEAAVKALCFEATRRYPMGSDNTSAVVFIFDD